MSIRRKCTIGRSVRAVLASVATTVTVLAGAAAPASAATLPMTLSVTYGPSGGGGTLIGTVTPTPASPTLFPSGSTPAVQFQFVGTTSTGCSASAASDALIAGSGTTTTDGVLTAQPATLRRITSSKIMFQLPNGNGDSVNTGGLVLNASQVQSKWNVCVYDSSSTASSNLLASALYTLVLLPTITAISPTSSTAFGGQTVTVNGTGFTPIYGGPVTGSIGGAALTKIAVATNGQSLTAMTGPRAGDTGLDVTINAPGGTVSSLDPNNDGSLNGAIPFSYTNGITISPTTAAVGTDVTVDVRGAGFSQLRFDAAHSPTSVLAHIFLVDGAYDSGGNRGVAECVVNVVVSDTELACDLDLTGDRLSAIDSATATGSPVPDGAYILTVVQDGSIGSVITNPSIISSGAAFVVAPY